MQNIDLGSFQAKTLPPTWPKGLLTFALVIFLVALGAYFGLNYWNDLEKTELASVEEEFQNIRAAFPLEREKEAILFEKRLNVLTAILENHVYFSRLISALEELTHPEVYYTSFDFELEKNMIALEGVAENQKTFSEAVNGLINNPEKIQGVSVNNMKVAQNDNVNFSLYLFIQPDLLKYQPNDGNY